MHINPDLSKYSMTKNWYFSEFCTLGFYTLRTFLLLYVLLGTEFQVTTRTGSWIGEHY